MNLLSHFDRICIINLPERADRRRQVRRELRRVGLRDDGARVRFFPAIRPADAGAEPHRFPSVGARGCYLSHLAVLRAARDDGVRNVLVLEDDVAFSAALGAAQAGLLDGLHAGDWGMAYPGHVETDCDGPASAASWLETRRPLVCAHSYAVNGPLLAPLVDYLEACLRRPAGDPRGGPMHVDGALSMFRAAHEPCRTLIAAPTLIRQRASRSDIAGVRWFDRWPLRPLAGAARNLRERLCA
jgi:hypothetical protein